MSEHLKPQIPFSLVGFITIAYLCAVLSGITDIFSELFKRSTPLFLFTVSLMCLWEYRKSWNTAFSIWFCGTFTGLMAIEIVGVWTGFPFGHYSYTSLLGPQILGVPPIIGLNWVIVLLGSIQIVNLLGKKWNKYIKSLLSGLICMIFDIILEGAVMKLAYWKWRSEIIPIQNYISWFILSFLFSLFLEKTINLKSGYLSSINILYQLMFFLLIIIFKV